MSTPHPCDETLRELDACGCCSGARAETPVPIENRPGLDAVAFRAGTHPQFKASLLAGLSDRTRPALVALKTREDDDFAVALLEGMATLADVVTFYSERIANESYLRTATERASVLELARSIGYELNPGVAAKTLFSFTVDDAPGSPGYAKVAKGSKVQSVPGPDEKPQIYETVEPILARAEWNLLRPVGTHLPPPYWGQKTFRLKGIETKLKPGDPLLIVGDERAQDPKSEQWDVRRVLTVEAHPDAEPERGYTLVTLDRGVGHTVPVIQPAQVNAQVYALRHKANLFGYNAPSWLSMPKEVRLAHGDTETFSLTDWPGFSISGLAPPAGSQEKKGLFAEYFRGAQFRQRAAARVDDRIVTQWLTEKDRPEVFSIRWRGVLKAKADGRYEIVIGSGSSAKSRFRIWLGSKLVIDTWEKGGPGHCNVMLESGELNPIWIEAQHREGGGTGDPGLCWKEPDRTLSSIPAQQMVPEVETLLLDASYPQILAESWAVLSVPEYDEVYRVTTASEDGRSAFSLAGKSTRLTVSGENLRSKFDESLRKAAVFGQSELLRQALSPLFAPLAGDRITLDRWVPEIPAGRTLLVSGAASRVRIKDAGAHLVLDLKGGREEPLAVGEYLTLLDEPFAAVPAPPDAPMRLKLRTLSGKEGVVEANLNEIAFVAGDPAAGTLSETVTVKQWEATERGPRLVLSQALQHAYDPSTVTILGNVATATHGESVDEVIGSGDAGKAHQRFTLNHKPLTCTPSSSPSGGDSTLEIWVDNVKWQEVPSLFSRGANDRVYVTRIADDATVTVIFGDGVNGARLPTGQENVRALYRQGTGLVGMVKAKQLTLLMTRPLGVKSVLNPQVPAGAADPQLLEDARENAPLTVLTLDRVVSLKDYQDFAQNFNGIVKAHAVWTWNVNTRGVFITVAGPKGSLLGDDSPTRANLIGALTRFAAGKAGNAVGNPLVPVTVSSIAKASFRLKGTVYSAPDRNPDLVLKDVKQALSSGFSFDSRSFGQPVALSEVEAAIQNVPGVVAVDIDELYKLTEESIKGTVHPIEEVMTAVVPVSGAAVDLAKPAELIVLDETSLSDLAVKSYEPRS